MRTIHKFRIYTCDRTVLTMPKGARVLAVQMQGDEIQMWADVHDTEEPEKRTFDVRGTGHEMPHAMGYSDAYIATVQDGPFVWHVYEVTGI